MNTDNGHEPEDEPLEPEDSAAAEGIYEICKAFADLIRDPKVADAAARWLDSIAHKQAAARNPIPYYVSLLFGLLIFTGIAILACKKVLDSQASVVLIGALIAAWWGGQKPSPK